MNCRDPVFWDSVCFIQMSSLKLISTSPQTRLQYGTWLHKACCWLLVNSAQSTVTDHFTCLIVDIPLQQRNRIRQVTTRFCQHCQPAHKHFTQEDILLYSPGAHWGLISNLRPKGLRYARHRVWSRVLGMGILKFRKWAVSQGAPLKVSPK